MITADKRKAVFLRHQEGVPLRQIARQLRLSRNAVRGIIAQSGQMSPSIRSPALKLDPKLWCRLHQECHGYAQRMMEKLREEHGMAVKYSTLTRRAAAGWGPGGLGGGARSSRPGQVAYGAGRAVRERAQVHELVPRCRRRGHHRPGYARPADGLWPGAGVAGRTLRRPASTPARHDIPSSVPGTACARDW